MIRSQKNRRGAILVLAAACLIIILAFAAFTVDLGYIVLSKSRLQNATDAAALAAVHELYYNPKADFSTIRAAAVATAKEHMVGQEAFALDENKDVEIGTWDYELQAFSPVTEDKVTTANAVRVTSQMSDERGNSLNLFFAPVIGHESASLKVTAIAATGDGKPRDVMEVIDCSKSMEDYNRMTYTRPAALALIDEMMSEDRMGLTVYSYPLVISTGKKKTTRLTGHLEVGLTLDHSKVQNRVNQLVPGLYASTTNIGGGMRVAIETLRADKRVDKFGRPVAQYIVLMTDGIANVAEPPETDPTQSVYYYAELARANNIVIHGVTLGSEADETAIRDAAELTGGTYQHVADGNYDQLFEAYRTIGRSLGSGHLVK